MPQFAVRSKKEELLDQIGLDKEELFQNLKELDFINKRLGGHHATLLGLKQLITDPNETYKIVDFACGGGDTLRVIHDWAKKEGFRVNLMGFDLLEDAIKYAKDQSKEYQIDWKVADFNSLAIDNKHDISICSLVCHHFYDEQLINFIVKMKQTAKIGLIINDLHRHPLAYYGIWILTALLSKSRLVKNDAKLSVLKGFKKREWKYLFDKNNITKFDIKWIWAFRHLIIIRT